MFVSVANMPETGASRLRWRLTDDDGGQPELFDAVERVPGTRELAGLEFMHVRAQRVINRVPDASRMPFRYTVNPYRGCSHACVYCFARPTHEYLNLDSGRDFESRIVVKVNAVERLRSELASPRWDAELIALGTNTDPYQPCEGRYRLTRGIVEALTEAGNPFSIVTKSPLVLRDLDVLERAAADGLVHVDLSIGCIDRDAWRLTEPSAPSPQRRLATVSALNAAGVPCGVLVAPVLPGISDRDEQLDRLVAACVHAGAASIAAIALHLRPGVREHYLGWLEDARPDLVDDHLARYRGAYLTVDERRRLSARVQERAAFHRLRADVAGRSPARTRRLPPGPGDEPAAGGPATAQLRLV
jgi:DNA repair photolyase